MRLPGPGTQGSTPHADSSSRPFPRQRDHNLGDPCRRGLRARSIPAGLLVHTQVGESVSEFLEPYVVERPENATSTHRLHGDLDELVAVYLDTIPQGPKTQLRSNRCDCKGLRRFHFTLGAQNNRSSRLRISE